MTRAFLATALVLLGAAGALLPRPAAAAESYDSCDGFITSLPAVINSVGTYCLNANLATSITSGIAININIDDVTLDCNDFRLDGLGGGDATLAYGIYTNGRSSLTVRNCNVRGFHYGMLLLGGTGHLVEDNRLDNNTYVGLRVDGNRSIVRRNRIADTGGSTAQARAFAVITNGTVDVLDNTVAGVVARSGGNGNAYGVHATNNASGSLSNNRLRAILRDGTGVAYGIYHATSGRVVMRDNDLLGAGGPGLGLRCHSADGSARDNLILGFSAGISGCSNDGGNVNVP
jgi:hypothetical protein